MIDEIKLLGVDRAHVLPEMVRTPACAFPTDENSRFRVDGLERLVSFVDNTRNLADQLNPAAKEASLTDDGSGDQRFNHTMTKQAFLSALHRVASDADVKALVTDEGAAAWKQTKMSDYEKKLDWLTKAARTLSGLAAKLTQTA